MQKAVQPFVNCSEVYINPYNVTKVDTSCMSESLMSNKRIPGTKKSTLGVSDIDFLFLESANNIVSRGLPESNHRVQIG